MAESPFPGMDPYLEAPDVWPDVHLTLVPIFREQLVPQLGSKYYTDLQAQIVIEHIVDDQFEERGALPDVAIRQTRDPLPGGVMVAERIAPSPMRARVPLAFPTKLLTLYIRTRDREKPVAAIELLSPANKRSGDERRKYLEKRAAYLQSGVHLIEIDLLRHWSRMPLEGKLPPFDYLVMVSNAYERPVCNVWPITVRQTLPVVPVPLLRPDPPVSLDLREALHTAYARARYELRVNYKQPASPPLSIEDTAWAAVLLAEKTE
jgi:hypothetical protein